MTSFDRVLFVLFSLLIVISSAYVLGAAAGLFGSISHLALIVFSNYQLEIIIASLLLFFLALRFLYLIAIPSQPRQQSGFVHDSELGQIKVSLEALEQVAQQVVTSQRGVRQARIRLQMAGGGVAFQLRVATTGTQNLVELAQTLQQAVKEQVERVTSVRVSEVVVLYSDVGNERHRPL